MSFADAVRTCLTKYVDFSGRARRSEYWWFWLATVIVAVVGVVITQVIGTAAVQGLLSLALFLPSLGAGVRRLHDTGRSGWWLLIGIIPIIGAIVLLVFFVSDSQQGTNQYGPNPKDVGAYA